MRIVCLSDTHSQHENIEVPEGDLLIHAGDLTRRGTFAEVVEFARWLRSRPHRHKIVIAGNHDFLFESDPARARALLEEVHYLEDSGVELDGIFIWGSPWQPRFFDWAFNLDRGAPLKAKWDLIPPRTHLLITHGPPKGILDRTFRGEHVGCEELSLAVERIAPRLHVFGHIHEQAGVHSTARTLFVNACNCDLSYRAKQPPIVLDWSDSEVSVIE